METYKILDTVLIPTIENLNDNLWHIEHYTAFTQYNPTGPQNKRKRL